jgi:Photosynthetic reaction centre cytochrome C subunit
MRNLILIILLLLLGACGSVSTPKQPPQKAQPGFKNLRVLPHNVSKDELIATMRYWSQSLNVGCDQCHQRIPPAEQGGRARLDFVSDARPDKNAARAMLTMTRRMNTEYVAKVAQQRTSVTCYTCHRGKPVPDSTLPQSTESTGR